jgi:hypothetical protein
MMLIEARHKQVGVIASPPPSFSNPAALRPQADKERIQAISDVSHDPSRTLSEFDIEVHIEKSIVRDVRPTYGEAIGPDGHAHPFTQGYHV